VKTLHAKRLRTARGRELFAFTRLSGFLFALALAPIVLLGLLFLVTPPASRASALVRAQTAQHRANFPAPPPPERFAKALIATEDHRFYSRLDPGIDPTAVMRAVVGMVLGWRDQGGSTIEQQLAKLLYTPRNGGLVAELEQVVLAVKLNFAYTKPEILRMYSETVYFGGGYYGVGTASCGYFGRRPSDLNWPQAAMLAGVLNAPSIDNPRMNPRAARARERHVLARLVAVGDLSSKQARAAFTQPLGLVPAARGRTSNPCAPVN